MNARNQQGNDEDGARGRPTLLELRIELEQKKILAAKMKKRAEESTEKVKQMEQHVNTCKMKWVMK